MQTVYKYNFALIDKQTLQVKQGSIVHVGLDPNGDPAIWIEVNSESPFHLLPIFIVGTGGLIPYDATRHVGSFVKRRFVWHVYV
jgi:hypothetical protein